MKSLQTPPSTRSQLPYVPPQPPRKTFIDMLRTRGLLSPFTSTVEVSDGHFQIRKLLPQYGHIGLRRTVRSGSQLIGLFGSKSSVPVTHAASYVVGSHGYSLAKSRTSWLSSEYSRHAR